MKRLVGVAACLVLGGLSANAIAAGFSYSFLEATGDRSKTGNTAHAPVEDDAQGRLFGVAGSFEVLDAFGVNMLSDREPEAPAGTAASRAVDALGGCRCLRRALSPTGGESDAQRKL